MRKLNLLSCALILVTALFIGFESAPVHAVTPDISQTVWTLDAAITANVKKIGKVTLKEQMMLYIGPSTDPVLGDSEWKWIDSQGDELIGAYHERQDKLGKGFYHFEPTNLQAYMQAKIQDAANGTPISDIIVGTPSGDLYPKAKTNNKGLNLTLSCSFKADVSATFDGQAVETKITLNLKGKGLQPAEEASVAGSQWSIDIKILSALKKVGKIKDDGHLNLLLGPNLDPELAENEFLETSDEENEEEDVELRGTYVLDKKKITFSGLEDEFQVLLVGIVEEALEDEGIYAYDNVQVQITSLQATATVKPGVSLKLKIKVQYNASAIIYDELETSSGSFTVTGTGTPVS